jgi:hypothetical protein
MSLVYSKVMRKIHIIVIINTGGIRLPSKDKQGTLARNIPPNFLARFKE